MRILKSILILATVLSLTALVFLFTYPFSKTQAEKQEFWVTIDANEFKTVQADSLRRGIKLDLEIRDIQGGIAIVKTNSGELERLSGEMHKHFHKCSGFIAHQTQMDAETSLSKFFVTDGNQRLVDYTIDNQAAVNQLLPGTQEIRVRQMIIDLSSYDTRRHDQPSGLQSAQFIKNTWTTIANGRNDISVDYFNHASNITPQPSVILSIQGTETPSEVIVIGGHQDSIRSGTTTGLAPGADDDASGIGSLTEVIRVIVEKNFRPKKTVKFMAYAAEEVGLRGSGDIAQNYSNNNINVIGALQLDMTNFKGNPTVDFAFESDPQFSNVPQTQFLKDLVDEYLPTLSYANSQCNYGCSDHASWHNNGFPASFPFEAPFGEHNSTIHSANDKIEVSGGMATHAEKFSKLTLTFVGELAKGEIPAVAPENRVRIDFDGDKKTDVSIFRPNVGEWWYLKSTDGGNSAFQFGSSTDKLIPADYTGDGKTDIAFWRNSTEIFVMRSEDSTFYSFPFGAIGDIPAPGDYDGDGKDDAAVFRPSTAIWFINRSSDNQTVITGFGVNGDKPVIADYDGDGTDDIAIYRPAVSQWWINRSTDGVIAFQFGASGDQTVQGDYTGDGKADVAFWRPSSGEWYIIRSEDSSFYAFPFGSSGDIPTPGDYDGDGKMDATVFRPSNNTWFKQQSTNGFEAVGFGSANDYPVPNIYVVE